MANISKATESKQNKLEVSRTMILPHKLVFSAPDIRKGASLQCDHMME